MRRVELIHEYDAPAREVWEIAIDYACLAEVMQGLISFVGLPTGRVKSDQAITVMVSLFGKLPSQPYDMQIVEFDDAKMSFTSSERGAGVKSWRHSLQVKPTATGCQLTDKIEIDAGLLTWPFALWARFLYRKRHNPRLKILDRRRAKKGRETPQEE